MHGAQALRSRQQGACALRKRVDRRATATFELLYQGACGLRQAHSLEQWQAKV
jgi:hypothetical protein